MKTFKQFVLEQNSIMEMVKTINDSPSGILGDISWRFGHYSTLPNEGTQEHQVRFSPNRATTMIHHVVDGKPQAVSVFSNRENFSTHDLTHKLSGSGEQIRQNIVKMNSLTGKPVVSDGKQTPGASAMWNKWRDLEPENVKMYQKVNDGLIPITDQSHPLLTERKTQSWVIITPHTKNENKFL